MIQARTHHQVRPFFFMFKEMEVKGSEHGFQRLSSVVLGPFPSQVGSPSKLLGRARTVRCGDRRPQEQLSFHMFLFMVEVSVHLREIRLQKTGDQSSRSRIMTLASRDGFTRDLSRMC